MELQPIIEARKRAGEWDYDAFGTTRTDKVDTRIIEEAIVVTSDPSRSMQQDFNPPDDDITRDPDVIAAETCLEHFGKRGITMIDALQSASFDISLEKVMAKSVSNDFSVRILKHDFGIERLERKKWFGNSRQYTVASIGGSFNEDVQIGGTIEFGRRRWEDIVAIASDQASNSQLVDYLLEYIDANDQGADFKIPNGRFVDPFSGEIFVDPVRASDGYVYERRWIEAWQNAHGHSPIDPTIELDLERNLILVQNLSSLIVRFLNGRPRAWFNPTKKPLLIEYPGVFSVQHEYVPLPGAVTVLSILIDQWMFDSQRQPSTQRFWHGLTHSGDGTMHGTPLDPNLLFHELPTNSTQIGVFQFNKLELASRRWNYRQRLKSRSMSRLDVAKQAFEALVNKSEAFDHPVGIGLVTFGREVREVQTDGDTPLYDSLVVGRSMLERFKAQASSYQILLLTDLTDPMEKNPSAALRIICLTDGEDVGSRVTAAAVAAQLQRSGIILDSIVVQTSALVNAIHPIAVATGGYSFKVDTVEQALNIVELETVLRSKDCVGRFSRGDLSCRRYPWHLSRYNDLSTYPWSFVLAFIDVYTGDDLAFWKSPYEGGTFLAYYDFGKDYPQAAPEVRFITPILHPNINRHGKVCHAALDKSWLVDISVSTVLQILYGILLTPDTDNPLDLHATMEYNDDSGQHALKVHNMVQKFASKTRAEWKKELDNSDYHNNLNLISQSPEGRIGYDHHRAPNAQTYRVKRMEDARESAADRGIGQLDGTPTSPTALRGDKCASHMLTADHPNVARYLDSLARAYHAHMEKLGPSTSRFSKQSPAVCKLGKVESVNAMLGAGSDLDQQQCECILALAALKTYNNPSHPAHFALWGRSIDERTEALVTKIAYHKPALIELPTGWFGGSEAIWHLRRHQGLAFPKDRIQRSEEPTKMTLRQRKTASSQCAGHIGPDKPPRARARFVHVTQEGSEPSEVLQASLLTEVASGIIRAPASAPPTHHIHTKRPQR
ncbi:predicted protein, partial [Postia placenta Mad-698-R]